MRDGLSNYLYGHLSIRTAALFEFIRRDHGEPRNPTVFFSHDLIY